MDYFVEFLKQFTWVDIFVFAFFIRVIYISLSTGVGAEIFKFLGTLTGAFIALHYYTDATKFMADKVEALMPAETVEIVLFAALFYIGYTFFVFIRMLLNKFITTEVVPTVSRWGGLLVGGYRGIIMISMILYAMLIPQQSYINKSVKRSFSGIPLVYIAPSAYQFLWEKLLSKFMPDDHFNQVVFEIGHEHNTDKKPAEERK
jgi:uncharacterized membrane protein required for colicin V production